MIELFRVDDRLIHGQITTHWITHINANEIYVIDDETAKDDFLTMVLKGLAPSRVKVFILKMEDSVNVLKEAEIEQKSNAIVIAKVPEVFLYLKENGVEINELNVGEMGQRGERIIVYRNIACTLEEIETLRILHNMGVEIYFQALPSHPKGKYSNIIK
ncbi:MAG: PTS sugar transporter subunit IIB [Anaerolineaceae bacterium]|jgi:mannose/fructose/N-acetylgalactosamine-specific phosphotransferase system component IIB